MTEPYSDDKWCVVQMVPDLDLMTVSTVYSIHDDYHQAKAMCLRCSQADTDSGYVLVSWERAVSAGLIQE